MVRTAVLAELRGEGVQGKIFTFRRGSGVSLGKDESDG